MATKITHAQLASIIKEVARNVISEKCGGGTLPGGKKGERMFKHIKAGYKGEKDSETAASIAAATVKDRLGEGEKSMHEYEPEDDTGPTPKHPRDMEKSKGNFNPDYQKKWKTGKKDEKDETDEAGLTSEEDGEVTASPDDMDDESTDEQVNDHIAALLKAVFYSEKTRHLSNAQKVALVKKIVDQGLDSPELKEASYKKVSPNETDTSEEDKARTIQTDPEVNEAAYKVVAPNEVDTAKEDKARTIQTEPKVTENHKVQARSYKTAADLDNDPANVRDPEVPQA